MKSGQNVLFTNVICMVTLLFVNNARADVTERLNTFYFGNSLIGSVRFDFHWALDQQRK